MKAYIIELVVYEGIMDFAHAGGAKVERIYIVSEQLVLGIHNEVLVAFYEQNLHLADDVKIIEEIEIEESLVEQVKLWIKTRDSLTQTVQNLFQ